MDKITRFGCQICGSNYKLVTHHVEGGKKKHRDNNPYQKLWIKLGLKKIILCKPHEDKIHMRRPKITKHLSWNLELHPYIQICEKERTNEGR